MDSNVVFPRKLLKRFILLYKDLPCLWDKNCFGYKQKQKRHDAISKLTQLVQEYDPTATRVHILRKIESLRACIRREHKRVVDSRRKATCPDEIFVPTLWYYDLFSFIFPDEDNTPMKFNTRSPEQVVESTEEDDEENADETTDGDVITFDQPSFSEDYNNMVGASPVPSISKRLCYDDDQKANKRQCTEVDDEYDAIGINVAAKLRALPPNMRILAEKLINDVLFQAQVNGLNSSTVITTTDPFKHDVM